MPLSESLILTVEEKGAEGKGSFGSTGNLTSGETQQEPRLESIEEKVEGDERLDGSDSSLSSEMKRGLKIESVKDACAPFISSPSSHKLDPLEPQAAHIKRLCLHDSMHIDLANQLKLPRAAFPENIRHIDPVYNPDGVPDQHGIWSTTQMSLLGFAKLERPPAG